MNPTARIAQPARTAARVLLAVMLAWTPVASLAGAVHVDVVHGGDASHFVTADAHAGHGHDGHDHDAPVGDDLEDPAGWHQLAHEGHGGGFAGPPCPTSAALTLPPLPVLLPADLPAELSPPTADLFRPPIAR